MQFLVFYERERNAAIQDIAGLSSTMNAVTSFQTMTVLTLIKSLRAPGFTEIQLKESMYIILHL